MFHKTSNVQILTLFSMLCSKVLARAPAQAHVFDVWATSYYHLFVKVIYSNLSFEE